MSRNRGRGWRKHGLVSMGGRHCNAGRFCGAAQRKASTHTQDLLSRMYQLSLDPPVRGRFHQSVTNGNR